MEQSNTMQPKKKFYKKWWFWLIVVLVIGAISQMNKDKKNEVTSSNDVVTSTETTKEEEKSVEPEKPKIVLPSSQLSFMQKVESFYSSYDEAPNELKKSALRTQRKDALSNLISSRRVSEWIGTLKDMQTNSEGKAFIEIKLEGAESIIIKTWNNALSDIGDNTLIENGSELYNSISNLSEDDKVIFSGSFIPDDRDYIKEGSMSERGSMTDPEFIIKFSSIKKK